MKQIALIQETRRKTTGAFSLVEVMIGLAIVGVTFVSLYGGMTYGFSSVRMSLENLRATQILVEKMETIRLYTWSQVTDNNFIPKTFQASYSPTSVTNRQGVVYAGTVDISKPNLSSNYDQDTRVVTITLSWKTGTVPRTRTLSTLVAQNGIQNYIY